MDKNACELLDADHIAVKHLFVDYARLAMALPGESAAERLQLARKICDEITAHATIEEEIFYPAMREVPGAADLVDEGEEEHQEAKDLIARIRALGSANDEMDQLVSELNRVIEHHVKEERDELFPKAKAGLGAERLGELGMQMKERQGD
jgi:iron-sulfur cluster repair protein YtfE (RIC family)